MAREPWFAALRRWWLVVFPDHYPACPICGQVVYLKSMPLHLSGHKPMDPDVIRWRERRAAERAANSQPQTEELA